jgi:hypothetical protein
MPENWHKRHALVLAGQLPENPEDARAVLREVQNLVGWLYVAEPPAPSKVVSLVRDPV